MVSQHTADQKIAKAYFHLSDSGLEFVSYDQQAFLFFTTAKSVLRCGQTCFQSTHCRTFNYNSESQNCSLYEGDADVTGLIVPSSSIHSLYGSIQLIANDFVNHGNACSTCENSRYLTCTNSTCQCQIHTYFDGFICRSQKFDGSQCTSDIECRDDMNLMCSSNNQCSDMTIPNMNVCDYSCLNETWNSSANVLSQWLFDGNYLDQMNHYNLNPSNSMKFITNGYANQALVFANTSNSMLQGSYIPILNSSFTIDVWLYITSFKNILHHGIFGLCSQIAQSKCLYLTIRRINANYYLNFGFYNNDCRGNTSLKLNVWVYVAFVYDFENLTQSIYLNGMLDNSCIVLQTLSAAPTNITIGYVPLIASTNGNMTYFKGYMDQMTVSNRVKSACEISEIAALVTYFTFDTGLFLKDSGPNSLQAMTRGTFASSFGRYGQALTFGGSSLSYFQIHGFTALGMTNQAFSISLWIRPSLLSGTLVHMSTSTDGTGYCLPLLGFNTDGTFYAQIDNGISIVSVGNISINMSASTWSHIVQTWSSTNGLRLYVNNLLIASGQYFSFLGCTTPNYFTLGSTLNGSQICNTSQIDTSSYIGSIDDFRVYGRELSLTDISSLYGNGTLTIAPYILTSTNETVNPIYATVAGGSSTASIGGSGNSPGQYYTYEKPSYIFDNIVSTGYTNFGNCTISSACVSYCGLQTGFYFTPNRGLSLLLSFRLATGNNVPGRDALTITIEGSNSAALTIGSSWTLIYNGVTGLSVDPGRSTYGTFQNISNPTWYKSYRLLATSKRNGGTSCDSVRYGELQLFGY